MKKIIVFLVNIFICHVFYHVKYENINVVKKLDKCIICPNHSHILDPVWIYPKIDNMHIMAKSELFKNKIISKILKYFGAFPIRRGQKDAKSLIYSINVLKNNNKSKLLIFPEGGILSKDKRKIYITNGATYISAKTQIPIVPVYIKENPKIFSKILIVFGEPMEIGQISKNKELLDEKSQELLKNIYSMER